MNASLCILQDFWMLCQVACSPDSKALRRGSKYFKMVNLCRNLATEHLAFPLLCDVEHRDCHQLVYACVTVRMRRGVVIMGLESGVPACIST